MIHNFLNNYRYIRIGDKYLVTTDHGSWIALSKDFFQKLQDMEVKEDARLFSLLKEKGIIISENNIATISELFRRRYHFLNYGPSLHIVIPTLRCNQRCVYCHASSKNPASKGYDMTRATADSVIESIFQTTAPSITIEFQGGEPLLNFSIVEYITDKASKMSVLAKKSLKLVMVTNLTLLDEEQTEFIKKNGISVCTSLDGPKKVHDSNRKFIGGRGSYDEVVNKISNLRTEGIPISALLTVTRNSLDYPEDIIDEYLKQGMRQIHLRFLTNLGYASRRWDEIGYTAKEFLKFWKRGMDHIIKLNQEGTPMVERMTQIMLKKIFHETGPNYLDMRSPCGAAIGQVAYNHDGKMYTCDEGRMLGDDLFRIGDAKTGLNKALKSPETASIVRASINDSQFCDTCVYKPFCGLCPVCNYAEQGNIIADIPRTMRCQIFKEQFGYVFEELVFKHESITGSWLDS